MKISDLTGCKWLLLENQPVTFDFLDHRQYKALAKHIKPFLK